MRHMLILCATIVVLISAGAAHSATWNVIPGGGGDATTIQAGINLAANGDVVIVASGTYTGAGNVNVDFGGKNITVQSAAGASSTTIDCQGAARAFILQTSEGPGAVIEGFTIKNGYAVKGGAVYTDQSSPTIRYNVFSSNTATTSGGALYLRKGAPAVYNNTLDGNSAPFGGGMWVMGPGTPQVYQNIICNTVAGGAFSCAGSLVGASLACNDVYANTGGNTICAANAGNNFSLDPAFCLGNFFLQETSPCAAAYSPCAASVGALGILCTVTATESVTWGQVKSMYR